MLNIDKTKPEKVDRIKLFYKSKNGQWIYWKDEYRCPMCFHELNDMQRYCSLCGQKIDWRSE